MPGISKDKPGGGKGNLPGQKSDILSRIGPMSFGGGLKVCLYGESGSGKTTLTGTFPGPMLFIICSGGFQPGELRSLDTPENRGRISQVVLHSTEEILTLVDHIKEKGTYKTVVLDHISGFQDLAIREITGMENAVIDKSWGVIPQTDYNLVAQRCKEALIGLLGLDCNVVIVGQERVFKGKEDGVMTDAIKPSIGTAVIPSLALWLHPAADYVIQMYKRNEVVESSRTRQKDGTDKILYKESGKIEYCARLGASDTYITKFRKPKGIVLPDVIVDPDYNKLLSIINGSKK